MRSTTVVLVLAAVLLCAAAPSAARFNWEDPLGEFGFVKGHKGDATIKTADDNKKGKGGDEWLDRRTFIAIKIRVPPSRHNDFTDEWRVLESDTKKEKGNIMFQLLKTIEDNIHFMIYGEWETMDDWMDHTQADHTHSFFQFMEDKDITWELLPLKNVTSIDQEARGKRKSDAGDADAGGDEAGRGRRKQKMARVLFQYHIDPSVKNDFIDAWEDHAKDVWREDGNIEFMLRKVGTNNHHFYGFGMWESYDDFMDHFNSKHTRRMQDFFVKNDVVFMMDPMYRVGDEKREEM